MSDEERLKWLKEIEKDIFVCSLESTFVQDLKSCAIHSAIETLENQKTLGEELRKFREGITDENVLIGFNMAIAICNKYLGE